MRSRNISVPWDVSTSWLIVAGLAPVSAWTVLLEVLLCPVCAVILPEGRFHNHPLRLRLLRQGQEPKHHFSVTIELCCKERGGFLLFGPFTSRLMLLLLSLLPGKLPGNVAVRRKSMWNASRTVWPCSRTKTRLWLRSSGPSKTSTDTKPSEAWED